MNTTEHEARENIWRVGDCRVDPSGLTIAGPGGVVCVEPMVMDVLLVLMEAAGQVVTRTTLIDRVWQTEFGGDERLTRAISLLRKAFGDRHGVRRTIETVPKRGYRLIAEVAPFSPEAETSTIRTGVESALAEVVATPRAPGRRLPSWVAGLAMAAAAVAFATLAAVLFLPTPAAGPDVRTVAAGRVEIGEFQASSNDPALKALAKAMPANMTAILSDAGIETSVGSREGVTQSEFRVRGQFQDTGTGRRAIVELFNTAHGVVVWSDTFERSQDETGHLAQQVGASTAWIMRCALGVRGDAIDRGSDAFRQYARFCGATREKAQMKNLPAFTEAILDREPDRPTALGLHAWALAQQAVHDEYVAETDRVARFEQARSLADEALSQSPDNPYAHLAHSAVRMVEGDQIAAISHLEAASRAPNAPAQAIVSLAYQYRRVGRLAEAQILLARSLAIDPYDVYARTQFALMHSLRGNKSEALRQFERVARDNPDWWELYWRKLQLELFSGDAEAGLRYLERVVARRQPIDDAIVECARAFGDARLAPVPDLAAFEAACDSEIQADWRARMHAVLGNLDASFDAMEEFPKDMEEVTVVFFYPEMAGFRDDDRFWPMAVQFGLVDYWLETDAWPDFCGDRREDFDCRRHARLAKRSTTIQ